MASNITPTSDNEKLLMAFVNQLCSDSGSFPTPNYVRLATDLGLSTPGAAQVRWSRLTSKIKNGGFGDLKIVAKSSSTMTPKKRNKVAAGLDDDDEQEGGELNKQMTPSRTKRSSAARRKGGRKANDEEMTKESMNDKAGVGSTNNDKHMGAGAAAAGPFETFEESYVA